MHTGILDIFYNEFNRIRDEKRTKEEKKKEINNLLKKLLRRFIVDWEQFRECNTENFFIKTEIFYNTYRENFLDIFVEIEDFVSETTANKLKEICKLLEEGKNTIESMGREAYEKRKYYGDKVKEICEEIIKELNK